VSGCTITWNTCTWRPLPARNSALQAPSRGQQFSEARMSAMCRLCVLSWEAAQPANEQGAHGPFQIIPGGFLALPARHGSCHFRGSGGAGWPTDLVPRLPRRATAVPAAVLGSRQALQGSLCTTTSGDFSNPERASDAAQPSKGCLHDLGDTQLVKDANGQNPAAEKCLALLYTRRVGCTDHPGGLARRPWRW
jgi:hypothetical protein